MERRSVSEGWTEEGVGAVSPPQMIALKNCRGWDSGVVSERRIRWNRR